MLRKTTVGGALVLAILLAVGIPACGGGASGPGPGGAGQGLVLVDFLQAGVDNLPINTALEFTFSEAVDPATVGNGAMQIREGPDFGSTADGTFATVGSTVRFRPLLPVDCALVSGGLKAGTTYRVTVVGYPEELAVRNTKGQPLDRTSTYEFTTLPDTNPDVLSDQIPGTPPVIVSTTPASHDAAVGLDDVTEITVELSENIDPCSVDGSTVLLRVYEVGETTTFQTAPNGKASGFVPVTDQDPSDPYSWGASNSTTVDPAQTIPAAILLEQTFDATRLRVRPSFGRFPDNALVVLQMTFGIRDFGGNPLTPSFVKFTTENRTTQSGSLAIEFDASTPVDRGQTTADVNTARAPGRAQGYLLFAGDGDNGGSTLTSNLTPSFPRAAGDCVNRANSGTKTTFEPTSSVNLDTGSTRNLVCNNGTDGSPAVVWEFQTFRVRSGVTVRIVGKNPAILLVQGDVLIETGGILQARGDGQNSSPQGQGGNGVGYNYTTGTSPTQTKGGVGTAGAGDGGFCHSGSVDGQRYGEDGYAGFASPDYNTASEKGGLGAGQGQPGSATNTTSAWCAAAGGGGGHATPGSAGMTIDDPNSTFDGPLRGLGGGTYPTGTNATKLVKPSAGSGGGAGGGMQYSTYYLYEAPGGGGGAGGGFVDITSGGSIRIYGTLDAAGGRGGNGCAGYSGNYWGGGGGGGGSGGGIRLLTPNDIDLTGGTVTAAGGAGGTGGLGSGAGSSGQRNNGGAGGYGRLVLEDSNSIITGLGSATVAPGEGQDGFYRGTFQATRFQGGGLEPTATTGLMFLGPISPVTFTPPVAADFAVGIPSAAVRGSGKTSMLMEVQGYPLRPDGLADETSPTGWYTAGYFVSAVSGPQWVQGSNPSPGDVTIPGDNSGVGIGNIDGSSYIQARITFWLPGTIGATDPGPYVDRWTVHFTYDQ